MVMVMVMVMKYRTVRNTIINTCNRYHTTYVDISVQHQGKAR